MHKTKQHRNLNEEPYEWRDRQRNIVFPDTVRNARNVDFFFWHGSPRPTPIQRTAALLFGFAIFMLGVSFIPAAMREGAGGVSFILLIAWFCYIGGRIFWNGCKPAKR